MNRTFSIIGCGHIARVFLSALDSLDGKYAAFGKVISGMETVHKIGSCRVNGNKPIEPQRMKTVTMIEKSTIETNKGE